MKRIFMFVGVKENVDRSSKFKISACYCTDGTGVIVEKCSIVTDKIAVLHSINSVKDEISRIYQKNDMIYLINGKYLSQSTQKITECRIADESVVSLILNSFGINFLFNDTHPTSTLNSN